MSSGPSHSPAGRALSDGATDGGFIWTTGRSAIDRYFLTAGPVLRIGDKVSVYAGAGYGMRRLCWEDSEGRWMEVTDAGRSGLCAEIGAGLHLGRFTLSAGWLTLPSYYNGLTLSLGYSFGAYR